MVRETGPSGGRGRAAQSSGRPHEPSGNRRPQMDDRRRDASRGTELGLQAGSPQLWTRSARRRGRRGVPSSVGSPPPLGQSSSGLNMWPAEHSAQIGALDVMSPSGSGSRLSG